MESSPPSPMPFEYGEGDKDKKEKSSKKKSAKPFRIPLSASEVQPAAPKSFERLLPLFEKKDDGNSKADNDTTGLAARTLKTDTSFSATNEQTEKDNQPVISETSDSIPHKDLTEIHDALWSEFDATQSQQVIHEPTHDERAGGAAVEITDKTIEQNAKEPSVMPIPKAIDTTTTEEHAIDLNAPAEHTHDLRKSSTQSEDVIPAAPSATGMNTEVAATEPDDESVRLWEELNNAPQHQQAPAWHPESQPLSTNEQFDDAMQRADMGKQFIAATSQQPAHEPTTADVPQPAPSYGTFNTGAPSPVENIPSKPVISPPEQTNTVLSATGNEGPTWYPPRQSVTNNNSTVRAVAEAGAVGGAFAGVGAAQAAEAGTTLASGAAAGVTAGEAAGYAASERGNRQQMAEQVATPQPHHQATYEVHQHSPQQKPAPESPPPISVPPAETETRMHDTDDLKVAHSEWVDMAVDKHTGQLAEGPGINEFGNEFYAEQRANTEPADPLAIALAAAKAAARSAAEVTDTYAREHGQPIQHGYASTLPSGQVEQSHELSTGSQTADIEHRLPAPRHPITAALANPLLWAGVAILVLAFMAAAFI